MTIAHDEIILECEGDEFPGGEWRDYLKRFHVNWNTSKEEPGFHVWFKIEGKGYVIWISDVRPRWSGEQVIWVIKIQTMKQLSEEGRAVRDDYTKYALDAFPAMRARESSQSDD